MSQSLLSNFMSNYRQTLLLHGSKPAVVVFSGGQDSTVCLALAQHHHSRVMAVSFDYGQKHRVELQAASDIAKRRGVEHIVVKMPKLGDYFTSALAQGGDVNQPHPRLTGLPASFVPCRNALFLTMAHGFAQELGAGILYTGVCQTDYSGYPDCRQEFIDKLEFALNVGYQSDIVIATPLMYLNKAQTFQFADELGALEDVLSLTHTCYNGDHLTENAWGYGCGNCGACMIRANGFFEFQRGQRQ
jgi:7-cyano-7-deazaguanine synthase